MDIPSSQYRAETAIPAHRKKGHTQRMAHTPHDPDRVIAKAFLVRFFADGGFRVEGPFPPMQVQRLINTNECQAWLRDPALVAIWGTEPVANVTQLFTLQEDEDGWTDTVEVDEDGE